jgi:hypothetical protein
MFGAIFIMLVFVFLTNVWLPNLETVEVATRPKVSLSFMISTLFIIAPLLEEMTFRWSIGYFDASRVSLSLSLFSGYCFAIILYLTNPQLELYWYYAVIIIVAVPIFFPLFWLAGKRSQTMQKFWNRHLFEIIYLSAVLFSIAHLVTSKSWSSVSHSLSSFVVLFVLALVASFIKVRFGLIYCVLFHIAMNLPSALKLILMQSLNR